MEISVPEAIPFIPNENSQALNQQVHVRNKKGSKDPQKGNKVYRVINDGGMKRKANSQVVMPFPLPLTDLVQSVNVEPNGYLDLEILKNLDKQIDVGMENCKDLPSSNHSIRDSKVVESGLGGNSSLQN